MVCYLETTTFVFVISFVFLELKKTMHNFNFNEFQLFFLEKEYHALCSNYRMHYIILCLISTEEVTFFCSRINEDTKSVMLNFGLYTDAYSI